MIQFLLKLGTSGPDAPVVGGVIVFGAVGLALFYLAFVNDQMEAGPVLKGLSIALLVMAVVSLLWPMRPWPT